MTSKKASSASNAGFLKKAWLYLYRAIIWRCPVCGISPLFMPLKRVEGITDWFDTLDGCPRCDYYYYREPGYFLLALWVINFWIVAIFGVIEVLLLDWLFHLSLPLLLFVTLVTMWVLGILTARHTKAIFMAFDHLVHPHKHND